MSAKKRIAPVPQRWFKIVVEILRDGDIRNIRWTYTAEQEFHHFGFKSKEQAMITALIYSTLPASAVR